MKPRDNAFKPFVTLSPTRRLTMPHPFVPGVTRDYGDRSSTPFWSLARLLFGRSR